MSSDSLPTKQASSNALDPEQINLQTISQYLDKLSPYVRKMFDQRLYEFRASGMVYQRYKINKKELWLLVCLAGFVMVRGKNPIVSKLTFFRQITGHSIEKKKLEGYLIGNIRKGFINLYEYTPKPGSRSVGITPLGGKVLDYYCECMVKVEQQVIKASRPENGWAKSIFGYELLPAA